MDSANFRILIIDDNPTIHEDFLRILKANHHSSELETLSLELFGHQQKIQLPNFEIDVAFQGIEGIKYIQEALQQGRPYSLAFVDIRMPPGLDGIETIKRIWELDKDIQIVICTAYSDYSWEETVAKLGKTDNLLILKKPFDNIAVRQLACALTTKWQLAKDSHQHTSMLTKQVADRTLELQQSLSLVKSTFESSNDGILVVNNDGKVIDYNQKFVHILRIPESIIKTKSEEEILKYIKTQLEDHENYFDKLQIFHVKADETSIDVLKFKNGKVFECYSQPHTLNNKIIGRILDFRDITERFKLEEKLIYQATHDALTGLVNRVKLMEQMQLTIKKSAENNSKFAVLFLDFDRFKLINDSLSHIAGDELLQAAATRLKSAIGPEDTLSRLGGDEFVIIFTDIINEKKLANKVNKLFSLFQRPFDIGERKVVLTASVGISIYPKDGTTVDILLRNADAAMYHAKGKKGNNFQFYVPEMSVQSLAELEQETELRQALIKGEFFLCYQPQFDLNSEKLIAVEALLRWQHPKKGVLLPMDFIPLAEETGLIIPISEWVLRTACAQNKAWQELGLEPIRVAVNVTAQQFKLQNLTETVRRILEETKLEPQYLELELTENVLLSSPEIIKMVVELKKLNVSIAIDDFGTGYSSLSYLHKIPLDRLKIDASFIHHIQSAKDDEVIIRAVIAMAKNLNLEVLAEGVETLDQLNFLRKYKCEDVQGFYFSKPLMAEELKKLLEKTVVSEPK